MNRYGSTAKKHWQQWLPQRYSQLQDPDNSFLELGEEIQTRIDDLSHAMAGKDKPSETYMEKLGRLNMARLNAESQALQELALLDPESEGEATAR